MSCFKGVSVWIPPEAELGQRLESEHLTGKAVPGREQPAFPAGSKPGKGQ